MVEVSNQQQRARHPALGGDLVLPCKARDLAPLRNMARKRAKADMAGIGPYWLKGQIFAKQGVLGSGFKNNARRILLSLSFGFLLPPVEVQLGSLADAWPAQGLGLSLVGTRSQRWSPMLGCVPHPAPAIGTLQPCAARCTGPGLLPFS